MNLSHLEFWTKILELANKQGLSQPMLADRLDIPLDTLKGWIYRGKFPPLDTTIAFAKYFNVSLDWLCNLKSVELSADALKIAQQYDIATEQNKKAITVLLGLQ